VLIDCNEVITSNPEGSFTVIGEGASEPEVIINYRFEIF
jgi:hypothetical protein